VIVKAIFERLVLFPGPLHFEPFVTIFDAPTPTPLTIQPFFFQTVRLAADAGDWRWCAQHTHG